MDVFSRPDVLAPIIIVLVALLFVFGTAIAVALGIHMHHQIYPQDYLPAQPPTRKL